jgi:hypothetical protein
MPITTIYRLHLTNGNEIELPGSTYSAQAVETMRQAIDSTATISQHTIDLPEPIATTDMTAEPTITTIPIVTTDPTSPTLNEAWVLQKTITPGTANGTGAITNAELILTDNYILKINLPTGIKQTPLQ